MKAALSLLCLIATMNFAFAFAGPPPFTNGSPLITGTDGTYQATASGVNLTGVFSFVISGGLQTSTSSSVINSWVFFVDGQIVQGPVVAAISRSDVVGVMNGGTSQVSLTTGTNGALTLPTAFIVPGNTASGEFRGSISLNNPYGSFRGKGTLEGAPERIDQLVVITEPSAPVVSNGVVVSGNTNVVTVQRIVIPGSTFGATKFKFHGTRVSVVPAVPATTGSSGAASPAASPSSG
jgi:hypothetical protein